MVSQIEDERKSIKNVIQELFVLDPNNYKLNIILEFYNSLGISSNDKADRIKTQLSFERLKNQFTHDKNAAGALNILDERAVIILIGIYNTRFGVIKKVSPNIHNVFGTLPNDIINTNIKQLMPAVIANKHDNFIKNYLKF